MYFATKLSLIYIDDVKFAQYHHPEHLFVLFTSCHWRLEDVLFMLMFRSILLSCAHVNLCKWKVTEMDSKRNTQRCHIFNMKSYTIESLFKFVRSCVQRPVLSESVGSLVLPCGGCVGLEECVLLVFDFFLSVFFAWSSNLLLLLSILILFGEFSKLIMWYLDVRNGIQMITGNHQGIFTAQGLLPISDTKRTSTQSHTHTENASARTHPHTHTSTQAQTHPHTNAHTHRPTHTTTDTMAIQTKGYPHNVVTCIASLWVCMCVCVCVCVCVLACVCVCVCGCLCIFVHKSKQR